MMKTGTSITISWEFFEPVQEHSEDLWIEQVAGNLSDLKQEVLWAGFDAKVLRHNCKHLLAQVKVITACQNDKVMEADVANTRAWDQIHAADCRKHCHAKVESAVSVILINEHLKNVYSVCTSSKTHRQVLG